MRVMSANPLHSVVAGNFKNINTSKIINADKSSRIETLQEDILYFRGMIEQVAKQKNAKTDPYASILKSCDSALRGNYHKMHKKYLDLLNKAQAHEAEMHLNALEGELNMLIKHQTAEADNEPSWAS